jgi:hypothetical protein
LIKKQTKEMAEATIMKLVTESEGVVYFKVLNEEATAYQVVQICHIKKGITHLKYRNKIHSSIYKSEIGRNYVFVNPPEVNQLRQSLQQKMLSDFKLLVDVFDDKFKLL